MIRSISRSLKQLLGADYIEAVTQGYTTLFDEKKDKASALANDEVEFYPESFANRMNTLLPQVGCQIIPGLKESVEGAPTDSYRKATNIKASPLCGMGIFRLGEDGKLYIVSKSEHYHAPLGHAFPGYKLLEHAKALGITNATHNNTRGYITRLCEMELVRAINGIDREDKAELDKVLVSREPHVLNRVINLETGSIAVEAGIKMMLARFYKIGESGKAPKYDGRIPVFFVMADNAGGVTANYHGTTIFAQTLRGMWPDLYDKLEKAGMMQVCPVLINDFEDFREKMVIYNTAPYKTAGFLHEIIMMNYGGIRLSEDYLNKAYALCRTYDTPVLVDEIQSCMWYHGMFLFREYGLKPDFVSVGKGFPGGQYPASRIITTAEMDSLNQFGALVTNGQEELASLSYLITMEFAQANAQHIHEVGVYYEAKMRDVAAAFPTLIENIEGQGLLLSICFKEVDYAVRFCEILNADGIDISAQTCKPNCPPVALTKLPVIVTENVVDFLVEKMIGTLKVLDGSK